MSPTAAQQHEEGSMSPWLFLLAILGFFYAGYRIMKRALVRGAVSRCRECVAGVCLFEESDTAEAREKLTLTQLWNDFEELRRDPGMARMTRLHCALEGFESDPSVTDKAALAELRKELDIFCWVQGW